LGLWEGSLESMVDIWRGRRVFLTGHTGFKGGWLSVWLSLRGAVIRGFSLDPDTNPSFFSMVRVQEIVDDVRGDIRDYAPLQSALSDFSPEVVFHLAAQPLVRRSYADPLTTYATNVMGTANLLNAVRSCPSVKAVVCITTDKCYENREWIWPYRETDGLGGHDPYASSKACAELVTAAFRSSFFSATTSPRVGIATSRAGNVIGGGDWSEDRLIPDLVRGFESGTKVQIRNPKAIRPWQHVLEPLEGYLRLAENLLADPIRFGTAYNFGPDQEGCWPVERILQEFGKNWGGGAAWEFVPDTKLHEAQVLRLDSSKSRAELSWLPRLKTVDAIRWTAEWYKAWTRGADLRAETIRQIKEYQVLI